MVSAISDGWEVKSMSLVTVKENETLENALRRFKRNCAKEKA